MGDNDVLYVRSEKNQAEGASSRNEEDIWDDTALILAYDHAVNLAKSEVEQRMKGVVGLDDYSADSSDNNFPVKQAVTAKNIKLNRNKARWQVGSACRSVYSADGLIYEADILDIRRGGVCNVRYVGYNNEEEVNLNELQPSHGQGARDKQRNDAGAAEQEMDCPMDTSDCQVDTEPKVSKRFVKPSPRNMDHEFPAPHRPKHREYSGSRQSSGHGSNFPSSPRQQHQSMSMPQMMVPPPPPLALLAGAGPPGDESEALSAMLMSWYMSGFHTGYYQGMKHGNNQVRSHYGRSTPRRHKQ